MPQTVFEQDWSRFWWDWSKWPVPVMADVPPGQGPWDGMKAFWNDDVRQRAIDPVRSAALKDFDVPIGVSAGQAPYDGSSYGMPYHVLKGALPGTAGTANRGGGGGGGGNTSTTGAVGGGGGSGVVVIRYPV